MEETRAVSEDVRDEDDHDLLTFLESGIRLREEISQLEKALEDAGAGPERAARQERLALLQGALARISSNEQRSPGEAGFLNYSPRTGTP